MMDLRFTACSQSLERGFGFCLAVSVTYKLWSNIGFRLAVGGPSCVVTPLFTFIVVVAIVCCINDHDASFLFLLCTSVSRGEVL